MDIYLAVWGDRDRFYRERAGPAEKEEKSDGVYPPAVGLTQCSVSCFNTSM